MGYYRVTMETYVEGEYDSEEKARKDFLDAVEMAGLENMLTVSKYDEEKEKWS